LDPYTRMLHLLARRLRGVPSTSSLPLQTTCLRCSRTTDDKYLLHTSSVTQWRTREERRSALNGDNDGDKRHSNRSSSSYDDRENDDGRRHHARPSYPRRRTGTASDSRRPEEQYQRRSPREYERRSESSPREGMYNLSYPSQVCLPIELVLIHHSQTHRTTTLRQPIQTSTTSRPRKARSIRTS